MRNLRVDHATVPLGYAQGKCPVFDNQSPGMVYPYLPSIIVVVRSPQLSTGTSFGIRSPKIGHQTIVKLTTYYEEDPTQIASTAAFKRPLS